MKVCVFSDSHGVPDNMLHAVYVEEPDAVIHLGDGERDLKAMRRRYPNLTVYAVCLEGVRVFAVHGHRHDVKYDQGLDYLLRSAAHEDADVILFGHTHVPYCETRDGVLVLNPGACAYFQPRYANLYLENGKAWADLCSM